MIRRATIQDVDTIMAIVRGAQQALAELGIDQWQDGYPSRAVIETDIEKGVGYVCCSVDNHPIGYSAFVFSGEDAYLQLSDDMWHTPNSYVVVHRLCVTREMRRSGIAHQLMCYAANMARKRGINAFRIDTHRGNIRMLQMVEKYGFRYCGIVRYDSGERLAYDLNLDLSNIL